MDIAETVIDNSTAGKNDNDVLIINGNINEVWDLAYDKKRDILMCNEIYIRGFSKLSKVTICDTSGSDSASADYIIREIVKSGYTFDLGAVNTEIGIYNKNLNTIIDKGFITNNLAVNAGYYSK